MGVCAGKILVSGVWFPGGLCREDTGERGVASWGSVLVRGVWEECGFLGGRYW